MSSVIRPVGPEEPVTYWKRRAILVVGALVVLFILWLIFKPSGQEPTPVAAPDQSANPSSAPTPGNSSASPSSSGGACADSDIKVAVTTPQTSYPSGSNPEITLTISNDGATPCSRDVGSDSNEIQISSGGAQVWSSDDCGGDNKPDVVTLSPGQTAGVTVEWPRVHSAPGCPSGQPDAKSGSYQAIGRNGKVKSQPLSFQLQ